MSEISVVVVGSTSINSVVGNGDTVNVNVGNQTVGGGNGAAATIEAGTVTTIDATQTATVTNVGTAYAAKFNFSLPRGLTGVAGPANSLSIGSVSTGATAAVSITGSSPSQSLSFVLQTGPAGPATSLSIGSVSTGATAAVSITGSAPSQSLSFVLPQGPAGTPNSLSIGSVTSGTTAAVSISGSAPSQSLSFVLQPGPAGPANSLSIGSVSTGTTAAVSISGTAPSQSISFVLPQGPRGERGDAGPAGPPINLTDETPQPLGTASAGTALAAARADHVHAVGSITYSSLSGIPSTFAPSAHQHAVSDVAGLQTALDGKQAAGTYATLVNNLVPSANLPSFVDDVVDVGGTLPASGDVGKIYVVSTGENTNKIYRWSGSAFIEISPSPGSTDSVTEGSVNLYHTTARAAAAAPVQSVAGRTGAITLAQLGSSGTASASTFLRGDGQWTAAGGLNADDDIDGQWFYGSSGLSRSITITSPPTNQTASSGAATFAVTAIAEPTGTLSYQWQKSDAGSFAAVQRTLPSSQNWQSVTFGNGTFVAVAYGGAIAATSADGVTWTQRTLPANASWQSVTFGNGTFVAVAYSSAIAATSTDGITWTQRTLPASLTWSDVTYGNGTFVAITWGYAIAATSTDGVTWTQRTLPASANWESIAFGNGTFVAVASDSYVAATSPDGILWTQQTMISNAAWRSITFGGGVFVVVASGTAIAATSTDGVTWTQRTLPAIAGWHTMAFGNSAFLVVSGVGDAVAASSPDGITWTQRTLPASAIWQAVTIGGSTFVAVAYNSSIATTIQLSAQTAFANISGATASTLALTGLTNAADNLDRFRAVVSAANASSVTSQPATLTVS